MRERRRTKGSRLPAMRSKRRNPQSRASSRTCRAQRRAGSLTPPACRAGTARLHQTDLSSIDIEGEIRSQESAPHNSRGPFFRLAGKAGSSHYGCSACALESSGSSPSYNPYCLSHTGSSTKPGRTCAQISTRPGSRACRLRWPCYRSALSPLPCLRFAIPIVGCVGFTGWPVCGWEF
jgi:hypothetical protein